MSLILRTGNSLSVFRTNLAREFVHPQYLMQGPSALHRKASTLAKRELTVGLSPYAKVTSFNSRTVRCLASQASQDSDKEGGQWMYGAVSGIVGILIGCFGTSIFQPITDEISEPLREKFRKCGILPWPPHDIRLDLSLPNFAVPRKALTNRLATGVFNKNNKGLQIIEIIGSRGKGKSTLALEYAHDYEQALLDSGELVTVEVFDASSRKKLEEQYVKFIQKLKGNSKDTNISTDWIYEKLRQRPGFLLIFDNLNDEKVISDIQKRSAGLRGQIILILSRDEALTRKHPILNLDKEENQLMPTEAFEIFSLGLEESPSANREYETHKKHIAELYCFNPLLVCLLGIVLKMNFEQKKCHDEYAKMEEIKRFLKEELANKTEQIDKEKTVYNLYFQCLHNSDILDACQFLIFLNPNSIPESIVRKWFDQNRPGKSDLDFSEFKALLEKVGLSTRKDGRDIKMDEMLRAIASERIGDEYALRIAFHQFLQSLEMYSTDNRFKQDIRANKHLALQFTFLEEEAQKYCHNNDFSKELFNLRVIVGNNHIQSNSIDEAKKIFQEAEKRFEMLLSTQANLRDKLVVLKGLHGLLPAIYAGCLHYIGKIHFLEGDVAQAKSYFNNAIQVRQIMNELNCNNFPGLSDDILFDRQGTGWVLIKERLFKEAEDLYKSLKDKHDDGNKMYCLLQLWRVYFEKASITSSKEGQEDLYRLAMQQIQEALALAKTTNWVRTGAYINALGQLYLAERSLYKDFTKAGDCFREVINLSKRHKGQDSESGQKEIEGEAYHLLAKTCIKIGSKASFQEAQSSIQVAKRCYKELQKHSSKRYQKELKDIQETENELELSRIEACLKEHIENKS